MIFGPQAPWQSRFLGQIYTPPGTTARGRPAPPRVGSDHPNPRAGGPRGTPNSQNPRPSKFSDPTGPPKTHWPSRGGFVEKKKRGLGVGISDPNWVAFPPESMRAMGGGGSGRFEQTATGGNEIYGRCVFVRHGQNPTRGLLHAAGWPPARSGSRPLSLHLHKADMRT